MKIQILSQPFTPDGTNQNLGELIIDTINSREPFYNKVYIVSAFARQRAILRLVPHLEKSLQDGAQIKIIVGIDHKGTTIEALYTLLNLGAESLIFNNHNSRITFHPKIYLFEADNHKAELFIGSNNLTDGGLYSNYETAVKITFNFPEDLETYKKIKASINHFINPENDLTLPISQDLINLLIQRNEIIPEASRQHSGRDREEKENDRILEKKLGKKIPDSPFGTETIPAPPSIAKDLINIAQMTKPQQGISIPSTMDLELPLLWRKENLPPSDVQRQHGNPTGGLRLVQAGWVVDEKVIDQTTYFRYDLFGNHDWSTGVNPPLRQETTIITAEIIILSESYGVHEFIVVV